MTKYIVNLFLKKWRYSWSNWRFRNSPTTLSTTYANLRPKNWIELAYWAKRKYLAFEWTMDGVSMLLDAVDTPASCFIQLTNGTPEKTFRDDCDGFHAAVIAAAEGFCEAQLFTYVPINIVLSHSVAVLKLENEYILINYDTFLKFDTIEQLIEYANTTYKILGMEFSKYTAEKGWHSGWSI